MSGPLPSKRVYSRVQQGPWVNPGAGTEQEDRAEAGRVNVNHFTQGVSHTRPVQQRYSALINSSLGPYMRARPPIIRQRGVRVNSGAPWELAGPLFTNIPLGPFAHGDTLTRCASEPPHGLSLIPRRVISMPSSLVETMVPAGMEEYRPGSAPYSAVDRTLPYIAETPASQAQLSYPLQPLSVTSSFVDLLSTPSLGSSSSLSSAPPSPSTTVSHILSNDNQPIANSQQLAEIAKQTFHNGRHGEWTAEKKEVLCAYYLGNSFPNMKQREALGRQVGLETFQVSKFFSRTRSEVKYSRTTLRDLALQASFGLGLGGGESSVSQAPAERPAATDQNAVDTATHASASTPPPKRGPGRPPGRGRGRGRGRSGRGGRAQLRALDARPNIPDDSASEACLLPSLGKSIQIGSNILGTASQVQQTTSITSCVQEAARSLMSISCAHPSSFSRPCDPYSQGSSYSDKAGPKINASPGYIERGGGSTTTAALRAEPPYFPRLRRTVSLFGPDARTLPPPALTSLRGRSGSPHSPSSTGTDMRSPTCATRPTKSVIDVRESSFGERTDPLSLAAELFLSVTGITPLG